MNANFPSPRRLEAVQAAVACHLRLSEVMISLTSELATEEIAFMNNQLRNMRDAVEAMQAALNAETAAAHAERR